MAARRPWWWLRRRVPKIMAIFSYRYDAHLVPALIENIKPFVDGWVALDDRNNPAGFSDDPSRRALLLEAAHAAGADWVLGVDPDERFDVRLATEMPKLTASKLPIVWSFRLREMYSPQSYRIDGRWGRKRQARLFPLFPELFPIATSGRFGTEKYHGLWYPSGYAHRRSNIDLYHLKMITAARRAHRRDIYKALDPSNRLQSIGYDYLAEEAGCVLKDVRPGAYAPAHIDDEGLWMPPVAAAETRTRTHA